MLERVPALAEPGPGQLPLLRDGIALVTARLPVTGGSSDEMPALLTDHEPERLLGPTARITWLASVLVRQLDELHESGETAWLPGLGLVLTRRAEQNARCPAAHRAVPRPAGRLPSQRLLLAVAPSQAAGSGRRVSSRIVRT